MTSFSTALLFVGPSGVGPFHSRNWRVGVTAQLVEAGSNGPYWLYEHEGREHVVAIEGLDEDSVTRSIVMLLGHVIDNAFARGWLWDTHNLVLREDGSTAVAPCWELADSVLESVASNLREVCRLGWVRLDSSSLFDDAVSAHLLSLGFDLDAFDSLASRR
jgi:hypothetical protein